MNAYRTGPAVPGLPLPRRDLSLYVGLVYGAAVLVAIAPAVLLPAWDEATGYVRDWRFAASTGVAHVTAVASGAFGARAVRGGRRAQFVVALLPAWPIWVSVFLPFWRTPEEAMVATAPLAYEQLGPMFAKGDVLMAHGCVTAEAEADRSALGALSPLLGPDALTLALPLDESRGFPTTADVIDPADDASFGSVMTKMFERTKVSPRAVLRLPRHRH